MLEAQGAKNCRGGRARGSLAQATEALSIAPFRAAPEHLRKSDLERACPASYIGMRQNRGLDRGVRSSRIDPALPLPLNPAGLPLWRNGRRGRLKICCLHGRAGSSPARGTRLRPDGLRLARQCQTARQGESLPGIVRGCEAASNEDGRPAGTKELKHSEIG